MTPTLDRQELDDLKASVDLVELFEAHGVDVRKFGRGFKARCPFHEEKNPSMSLDPKKGLYHCFGCGKSGDHFTFLQEHAGLSFAQALSELQQRSRRSPSPPPTPPDTQEPFPYDLMARVAEVWQQALVEQPEGLAYLESRGIHDKRLLGEVRAGYCDGENLLAITTEAERELLQRVGVLNEGGKEFFSRCVVFPLKDRQNRLVGFYGRSTLPR